MCGSISMRAARNSALVASHSAAYFAGLTRRILTSSTLISSQQVGGGLTTPPCPARPCAVGRLALARPAPGGGVEHRLQMLRRVARRDLDDILRRALGDDLPTTGAAFRAGADDPPGRLAPAHVGLGC